MNYKIKYRATIIIQSILVTGFLLLVSLSLLAQDSTEATISLTFSQTDTTKTVQATLTSNGKPVAGPEIHLYVQTLYSLLPIGKVVATDASGIASFNFPMDLPSQNGMLNLVAKLEKDEKYGDAETHAQVKWGSISKTELTHWTDRSLSASREKAPMFLVIGSILIIGIIWFTIVYVAYQLFRIKKAGKLAKV